MAEKKLTDEQVAQIFYRVQDGQGMREVGERFGVSRQTVFHIVHGLAYRHLGLPVTPITKNGHVQKLRRVLASLTDEEALDLARRIANNGQTADEICAHFNISKSIYWNILKGKSYNHVLRPHYTVEYLYARHKLNLVRQDEHRMNALFWKHVAPPPNANTPEAHWEACWDWTGWVNPTGNVAVLFVPKSQRAKATTTNYVSAARYSYANYCGMTLAEMEQKYRKMYVVRTCGNTLCVNPTHLRLSDRGSESIGVGRSKE